MTAGFLIDILQKRRRMQRSGWSRRNDQRVRRRKRLKGSALKTAHQSTDQRMNFHEAAIVMEYMGRAQAGQAKWVIIGRGW
jgi:hypothetical protein